MNLTGKRGVWFNPIQMKKVVLRQLTDQDGRGTQNEAGMSFVFCKIKRAVLPPIPV